MDIFLRPCPFCGGEAGVVKGSLYSLSMAHPFQFSVSCKRVEMCMGRAGADEFGVLACNFPTKQEAADAWNSRAGVTP